VSVRCSLYIIAVLCAYAYAAGGGDDAILFSFDLSSTKYLCIPSAMLKIGLL
jgi:hypothetical protein